MCKFLSLSKYRSGLGDVTWVLQEIIGQNQEFFKPFSHQTLQVKSNVESQYENNKRSCVFRDSVGSGTGSVSGRLEP